jgi:hypothetical protein
MEQTGYRSAEQLRYYTCDGCLFRSNAAAVTGLEDFAAFVPRRVQDDGANADPVLTTDPDPTRPFGSCSLAGGKAPSQQCVTTPAQAMFSRAIPDPSPQGWDHVRC